MAETTAPCTAVLEQYGFRLAETRVLGPREKAWGWTHPDGRACLVTRNGRKATPWALVAPGTEAPQRGEDEPALALALGTAPVARAGKSGLRDCLVAALRLLQDDWTLDCLRDADKGYTLCVRVLKRLRGTDKVAAKDGVPARVEEELAEALGVPPKLRNGARSAQIALRGVAALKEAAAEERRVRKEEQRRIALLLRGRAAVPGPAPLPVAKRRSKRQRAAERVQLQQELKEAIAEREAAPPLAQPKPDAEVTVRAEDVRLLEDPNNGLALLQVEKSNSQGAICVYNNGVRVAAGVVSPETLKTLRPVPGADIIQAANQLLTPIVESVVVTPVAQRHLTAVLNCKEIKPMSATAIVTPSKKFAPPREVKPAKVAKVTKAVVEKPAKKAVAPKADGAGRGRAAKFADEAKIVAKYSKKEPPYREGSARMVLLQAAAEAGTVGAYLKKAGEPSGGSAHSYLNLFVKEGHVTVK